MKKLLVTLLLATGVVLASAQDYKTALGGRFGSPTGFTIKHFINSNAALEGIVGVHYRGFEFVGLYEYHLPAFAVSRLNWFFGGGGHIAFYDGSRYSRFDRRDNFVAIGVDGIIGLDYTLPAFPLNFSVDIKPAFNISGEVYFFPDAALSVRYCF